MATVQTMSVRDFMGGKEWTTKNSKSNNFTSKKKSNNKAKITGLANGIALASMCAVLPQGISAQAVTASVPIMTNPIVTQPVGMVAGVSAAKISAALMPLLNLLQSLAFPITTIVITGACLLYMINKDKATTMMINGIVGYFLVQLAPTFMKILVAIAAGF